ncbi:MAG: pilus assembly protein [Planctomycetales bacterium]|nr:pilus assembly protein [Planctomycetales bacterium]
MQRNHSPASAFRVMRHCRYRERRGAIYFAELILVMPVLMILLLAVVQFGMFFMSLQTLNFASRVGAIAASEVGPLNTTGPVPVAVSNVVEQHLAANGITQCRIIIEHSGGLNDSGACDCTPSSFTAPLPSYVRVTVCAPQLQLMPNLLVPFGYDISDPSNVVGCSTVMRQEF